MLELSSRGQGLTRTQPSCAPITSISFLLSGIRILLELPAWEEELDPGAEGNRTAGPLWVCGLSLPPPGGKGGLWRQQGVGGAGLLATPPSWACSGRSASRCLTLGRGAKEQSLPCFLRRLSKAALAYSTPGWGVA